MTTEAGRIITVWSPDAGEVVRGNVHYETDTYIAITTSTGRQVGGPKSVLLPEPDRRRLYGSGS